MKDTQLIDLFQRSRKDDTLAVIEGVQALKHAVRFDAKILKIVTSEIQDLNTFLDELQDHKFVVCPKGQKRGKLDCFDTHRLWETLYMRRVPVILDHPYFHKLLEGFPVLYVNKWEDINEQLLTDNNDLYLSAQNMDLNKLNLNKLYENNRKMVAEVTM